MKTIVALAVFLIFAASAFGRAAQSAPTGARADMVDAAGNNVGTASLTETSAGVRITATLKDLPPGTHGMHIHTVGKCDPRASQQQARTSIPTTNSME